MDRSTRDQKTIYLWSDARSLSTAFLRAMMMADGCLVRLISSSYIVLNKTNFDTRENCIKKYI